MHCLKMNGKKAILNFILSVIFFYNDTLPLIKSKVVNASVIPNDIKAASYSPPSNTDNKKIKSRAVIHIKMITLHLVNSFFTAAKSIAFA